MRVPVSIWKWSSEPPPGPTRQQKLRNPNAVQGCQGFTSLPRPPTLGILREAFRKASWMGRSTRGWCAAAASASCWPRNPCREGEKSCYYVVCNLRYGASELGIRSNHCTYGPCSAMGTFCVPSCQAFPAPGNEQAKCISWMPSPRGAHLGAYAELALGYGPWFRSDIHSQTCLRGCPPVNKSTRHNHMRKRNPNQADEGHDEMRIHERRPAQFRCAVSSLTLSPWETIRPARWTWRGEKPCGRQDPLQPRKLQSGLASSGVALDKGPPRAAGLALGWVEV